MLLRALVIFPVLATALLASDRVDRDTAGGDKPRVVIRKRRTTSLPDLTRIRFESKLIVPQPPVGLYQIWLGPIRFNVKELFNSSSAREIANLVSQELAKSRGPSLSTAALRQLAAASLKESSAQGSTLFFTGRAVAEDQYNIFRSLESAMQELGVDGKACLLRTICELQESPVAEWTFLGEMFTSFLTPKEGNFAFLEEYQQARQLGAQQGGRDRCRPAFPQCPLSVFNFVPDIFGEDFVLPLRNVTRT